MVVRMRRGRAGSGGHWRTRLSAAALVVLCVSAGAAAPAAGAGRLPAHGQAVANPALLADLSAAEQAAIAHNGFVVTSPMPTSSGADYPPLAIDPRTGRIASHAAYWQFFDLYGDNYRFGIPTFLTSD